MKKVLSMLAAMSMLLAMTACGPKDDEGTTPDAGNNSSTADESKDENKDENKGDSGKKETLNVWAFTDEVPGMVDKYMEMNPDFAAKYEMKDTIIATTNGEYQPALDQALIAGGDDAPDIYAAEAAFILKYAQGDAAKYAAAYEDLGIDVAALTEAADIAN